MRVLAASAMALTVMMAWSGAEAAEARIDGFPFGCETPDGEMLKPKFGDVDGIFFADLPAQRKSCLETIDRMIGSCLSNTYFISHTQNEKFAACLPVFEKQALTCVGHFERERQKCYADGSSGSAEAAAREQVDPADRMMRAVKRSNLRSGPGMEHGKVGLLEIGEAVRVTGEIGDWLRIEAPGGGTAFVYGPLLAEAGAETVLDPKCVGLGEGAKCWDEIANRRGCHV